MPDEEGHEHPDPEPTVVKHSLEFSHVQLRFRHRHRACCKSSSDLFCEIGRLRGSGPEHSSARIERFLTLCAEDNIQVVNATTSAQYFHLLRRQVRRDIRKPLVVFAPKSPLRMKEVMSPVEQMTDGSFLEVLDDPGVTDPASIQRIVFCSGKVCWDAFNERAKRKRSRGHHPPRAAVPLPGRAAVADPRVVPQREKDLVWLQEEPENMGPWTFVEARTWRVEERGDDLRHVARVESGSPATGSKAIHDQELADLMDDAFRRVLNRSSASHGRPADPGSGTPNPDVGRAGAAAAVVDDDGTWVLIDAGRGATQRAIDGGLDLAGPACRVRHAPSLRSPQRPGDVGHHTMGCGGKRTAVGRGTPRTVGAIRGDVPRRIRRSVLPWTGPVDAAHRDGSRIRCDRRCDAGVASGRMVGVERGSFITVPWLQRWGTVSTSVMCRWPSAATPRCATACARWPPVSMCWCTRPC